MKITLDETTFTQAFQHSYGRCPRGIRFLNYFISGFQLVGLVVCPVGAIIEPDMAIPWIVAFISVLSSLLIFEGPVTQMIRRITLKRTGSVGLEISYSNEGMEIDSTSTTRLGWEDYTAWFEKEGLLLLYRRQRFLSAGKMFDLIDLNQISEEERASFMEIVRANIAKAT